MGWSDHVVVMLGPGSGPGQALVCRASTTSNVSNIKKWMAATSPAMTILRLITASRFAHLSRLVWPIRNSSTAAAAWRPSRIAEIAQYCESDVLNTYRLWLLYELFRGAITVNSSRSARRRRPTSLAAQRSCKTTRTETHRSASPSKTECSDDWRIGRDTTPCGDRERIAGPRLPGGSDPGVT
jgi:Predicted 3'-5' exonuclease related to the exonuclease domain of PolB